MSRTALAFMSYVNLDDQHDQGRLTQFRERLSGEVRMQTGEPFDIFQDRKDIAWGQQWQERINQSLDAVTFLIPIITPGFFKSKACREELERFLKREEELGRGDLILPVYYVRCPVLDDKAKREHDPLAQVIAARQYADWRHLRFEPFASPQIGKIFVNMAEQIVAALERIHSGFGMKQKASYGSLDSSISFQSAGHSSQQMICPVLLHKLRHTGFVNGQLFSSDGKLLTSFADNTIWRWGIDTGKLLQKIDIINDEEHDCFLFSPDGNLMASMPTSFNLSSLPRLWDAATGKLLHILPRKKISSALSFSSPNGRLLALGAGDNVQIYDVVTGQLLHTLAHENDTRYADCLVDNITFAQNSSFLASLTRSGKVYLWNSVTWEFIRVYRFRMGGGMIGGVMSFSPDNYILAGIKNENKTVLLWDVETGKQLVPELQHTGSIYSVAFSPDGGLLASGCEDKTIWLWNVKTGELYHKFTLRENINWVGLIAFSPDGCLLAVILSDWTICLYRLR